MADTITIGGTTYNKLVTFKDCASDENGGGGLFPWAFISQQDDTNYLDVVEINSNKYIVESDLTDTFLDSKNPVSNTTIGSTVFQHCTSKDDLIFSTDNNKKPEVEVYMHINGVLTNNNITGSLFETESISSSSGSNTVFEHTLSGDALGRHKTYREYKSLLFPTTPNSGIKVVIIKSNETAGYMCISFEINGKEEFKIEAQDINALFANKLNNIKQYSKLWSVCKLANKNEIRPVFTYEHDMNK